MSLAEFTKNVRNEAFKGLDECACQEAPHNSIKETIAVCKCNQGYISSLVREMKRNGLFGKLMKEMVNHPETFKALAILMEKDEMYARKLAKAMNEMVGPPVGDETGGGTGAPIGPSLHKKKPMPIDDMGMGDEDEDLGDEDMEDDMGDEPEDDMGDEGESDEEMDDLGDDDLGDEEEMGGDEDMVMPPKKPKLHAHHHLMNAMKDHPALMGGTGM
jgi:hypothetical protein